MRRISGFEFCDQPWLSGVWREAYLDGLSFLLRAGGVYNRMHEPFGRWAAAAGGGSVLELGSGGARQTDTLLAAAKRCGVGLPRILLSDLHPDVAAFRRVKAAHPDRVDYVEQPVDMSAPGRLPARLLLVCGAFHHLPPEAARAALDNAVCNADGIFIQEVFARHPLSVLLCVFNLLPLMLAPFFSGRLTLGKLLVSTLLPLVPLMIMFDGVVSVLRTYRSEELLAMLPDRIRREWRWEAGFIRFGGFLKAPYLCGHRRVSAAKDVAAGQLPPERREKVPACAFS